MKIPLELDDQYVKEVIFNRSLKNLLREKWKLVEGFESYAISNYGRVKSLEREVVYSDGRRQKLPERIMTLQAAKQFNKYLNTYFYNIRCLFSFEGKKYGKYMARLVYYHFVERFDLNDNSIIISYKDGNRFHIHVRNLEKLSVSDSLFKRYRTDRTKNHRKDYAQAVRQYTVEGNFVADFESITAASETLGIGCRNIFTVIKKEGMTAGGFRWFLKGYTPRKQDFFPITKTAHNSEKILNKLLWEKLGRPTINKNNPPACMNMSLEDLPGERWKPIPGLEKQFTISNKGRIKRLNTWTSAKNKAFFKEHIISLLANAEPNGKAYYLYTQLNHNGKKYFTMITRLLYYCYREKFDLKDRRLVIINQNEPKWDIDIAKLILSPR
ncbi:NUMOD4 domain-containing protein [Chryseobacterium sp. PTM-20240506]|uniref:NUMOD4 domain-containing protein n=1 Tax=Chryseobacterium sp. PTM-20240506 TaxID=3400631 RepID=UPI003AAA968E